MAFSIAPIAIEAAITVGINVVNRFFQEKTKKKEDLVSVGLAVGYFYNFLEPLNNVLTNEAFKLYKPVGNNSLTQDSPYTSYKIDDVNVEVIIPKRLDVEAILACENEFKNSNKGFFYLPQNNRFYGINYLASSANNKERLIILDFARPSLAAKQFYEQILGIRPFNNDEKWMATQFSELAAFKQSLINLQKLGYGVLVNKLHFKDIG